MDRIIEREGRDVSVQDIMEFVIAKARAATHPAFGKIVNDRAKPTIKYTRRQASGFITHAPGKLPGPKGPVHVSPKCSMCRENHWLPRCSKFRRQSLEERQRFIDDKKLCSNCLSAGHFVHECPKESFCRIQGCTGKHKSSTLRALQPPQTSRRQAPSSRPKSSLTRLTTDSHSLHA